MKTTSIFEATTAKRKVKQEQRAWKYIRDLCGLDVSDLNKTAIIDGSREYTYGLMFREWERYASVFTALSMTDEQNARVGVLGSTCAEVVFSFYALNMVGAQVSLVQSYSAFNFTRIKETILQEKLTDFILTDDLAQQDLVRELLLKRKELGLRHVIILHVPMGGAAAIPMMTAAQEAKYASMKALYRPICMETLLASFGHHPVSYSQRKNDKTALIIHTTGTTSGTGKPVPMSDVALNAAVASFMELKELSLPFDHLVSAMMVDLSNSYGIIDQVHLPFAMGATVVTMPFGFLNPWYYKVISAYRVSFLFSVNSIFERWIKMPEDTPFDFSSLKFVALGGTAVSAAEKKRYHEFLEAHGGKNVTILNGYGLSELGGACCLSSPDLSDESIGWPLPGITYRLYDEERKRFFIPKGEGGEGVLYMSSRSMATPELDGKNIIKFETIDRKTYICSNDFVRVDSDGRITYLGRANRFFLREGGRKYESGRVETEFSRLEGIESCAIVPAFLKFHHETVPMLCVKTLDGAGEPMDVILESLRQVFIEDKTLPEEYIPIRVMLLETFPRNVNGKIDLFKLNRGQVSGETYTVDPVRTEDQLTDFNLTPCDEESGDIVEQVLDDISADIKNKTPGKKLIRKIKKEEPIMGDFNNISGNFNAMHQMHKQMRDNMGGLMGQLFPGIPQPAPFFQTPDMMKMMESMDDMIPDLGSMMPGMQKADRGMQGMMPAFPAMMQNMAQTVLPIIHQETLQAISNFNQMNQIHFEMTQKFFEFNRMMEKQCFEMAMQMAGAKTEKEEAKFNETVEEVDESQVEVVDNA